MSDEIPIVAIEENIPSENKVSIPETKNVKQVSSQNLTRFLDFHLSIVGGSGSGKTYLSNHSFNILPNTSIFFNVMGLRDIRGTEVQTLEQFDSLLYNDTFHNQTHKIIVSPHIGEDADEYTDRVTRLIKRVRKLQDNKYRLNIKRRITLYFDEVQHLCENADFVKQAKNISLMGRNKDLFGVWISQRPQNINKNLFTQSNILFGLIDEFDHTYLKKISMDVPDVNLYEFYWWERLTGKERDFIKLVA